MRATDQTDLEKAKSKLGALKIARDEKRKDSNAQNYAGHRVKYLIRAGEQSETLFDRTISVKSALQPAVEIDMDYYIEKQIIPAIDRFLGAVDNKIKISPENYLKKARINEDTSVFNDLNVEENNICIICGQELRQIFKLMFSTHNRHPDWLEC